MTDSFRPRTPDGWDTSSRSEFFEYYARQSSSEETRRRYQTIYEVVSRVRRAQGNRPTRLTVADIGCGAGAQCLIWAENGHNVYGLDVNEPLLELARQRASERGFQMRLEVGSATALPLDSASVDVCLVPELLEHVEDWEACIEEFVRVLRKGGILYLSTTNKLCPIQHEFELPFYSWYPGFLKRHYVKLARSSRPELANFATYPAVNWFTYRQLKRTLSDLGMTSLDRFDVMDLSTKSAPKKWAVRLIRIAPPLRWLAYTTSPSTIVVAVK